MLKLFLADVDECMNGTVCGSHGFCENMDGSYRCLCYQGYQDTQDGQGCTGEFMVAVVTAAKFKGVKTAFQQNAFHIFAFCHFLLKLYHLLVK